MPSSPSLLHPADAPNAPAPQLKERAPRSREEVVQEPAFFHDLNLDQIVTAITRDQADYDLNPLYRLPLTDVDTISYRQGVFRDLEQTDAVRVLRAFADQRVVFHSKYRVGELHEDDHGLLHYYRERFFLNAVDDYCSAVVDLTAGLAALSRRSQALGRIAEYLDGYIRSPAFRSLHDETRRLQTALNDVSYVVAIRGDRLTVAHYDNEPNYGDQVAVTFARFQQTQDHLSSDRAHQVRGERYQLRDWEAYAGTGVLDLVAKLYPDIFAALDDYCAQRLDYLDPVVAVLDHDIHFYLTYLAFITPLRAAGLCFTLPQLSTTEKSERALDTFDLALAHKLHGPPKPSSRRGNDQRHEGRVVCNDITMYGAERILVVSGPNNGGKTTLARTFGQLHYLARLGCPIPGRASQIFVCDQIFCHFERAEDSTTMVGRLQTELDRLRDDFAVATPNSVIILNEIFNSTTAADALYLSRQILERVTALDALCLCVTFLDELSTLNDKTVSMVSTVVPDDPATRTYRVVRRRADGRAYARAIAEKYGLEFDHLAAQLNRKVIAGPGR